MQITPELSIRRNHLDWLRVIAILTVFLYHSLHFFDSGEWSVKNPTTYAWVGDALMNFMAVWMMPLIFLVSGASVFYAARKTKVISFIRDKVMRLLVPLLVGIFSFSVMQVYLERNSHGQFRGSFIEFIPHYFEGLYFEGSTGNFAFHGMHLWYLELLFVLTLVLIPLFWWFKGISGSLFLRRLGDFLTKPGAIILILVPTVIIQNLTDNGDGLIAAGGWEMVHYPWFFLAGYLITSHQKLQLQIVKTRWAWAGLSLALICASMFMHNVPGKHPDILVWPELFTIIGFAMKRLDFSNAFLKYSTEAVMPFYILHQNILLLLGFFIVNLAIPDPAKFFIIVISTFFVIMVAYQFCIRKYNPVRFLFGMKLIKKNTNNMESQVCR